MMRKRTLLTMVAVLATMLVLLAATPAWAVTVTVRAQGLGGEVCTPLQVDIPNGLTVTDSNSTVINCGPANPLGALYLAAESEGFTFVTNAGGAFLDSIAGLGGPPAWASWWLYAVNGCIPMVGMLDWELKDGDEILFFEAGGDPLAPWVDKALMVIGPTGAPAGSPVTLTVVGDDLAKANSAADAPRFGLDEIADVEAPPAFAPVEGATVHVGSATYVTDSAGQVTIPVLPLGTHSVWAEKAFDQDWQYIAGPGGLTVTGRFADVPAGSRYYQAIHSIAGAGIVGGYPGNPTPSFHPDATLWRAQFAKMIALALALETPSVPQTPFTDLGERTPGDPYPHNYVAAVHGQGIVKGLSATAFGPWEEITRAQVVSMVVRALQKLAPHLLTSPSGDFVARWGQFSLDHQDNARLAEFNGLLTGLPLDTEAADPWAPMTRAETAQIIANLVEMMN